ncbi:MAG TPA: serine O-acetyltransferase EpsC [Bacilli bacterium]|nr:serine O-acetyltransferase EpsC [Bacilli bacterium]
MELEPCKLINRKHIATFVEIIRKVTFPHFFKCQNQARGFKQAQKLFKRYISDDQSKLTAFFAQIDFLKSATTHDIEFTFESDPACNGYEEIVATYPGFLATFYHRIAHILYQLDLKLVARVVAEEAHFLTGIDIHPGAKIDTPFFIDHGTGIVIGETAEIGHHVKMYQGVTLGAVSLSRGQQLKNQKRHPTIGNFVTIYSGASILGGEVTIGDYVIVGSNVFLSESIPANHRVTIAKPSLIILPRAFKNQ